MTSRTLEQVLATAWSGVGQWWPNGWWPNGRSTFNDCAAFVSWALYGLNGSEPFYTYVPHIMDRAIREGRWHGGRGLVARPQNSDGAKGMQAGDVVILDWRFRGSRDHVGIALAAPNGGTVRVIQANNGGGGLGNANTRDPAEVVSYSTRYVLGYYRPAYATSTPAGGSGTPLEGFLMALTDQQQQDMYARIMGFNVQRYDADKKPARALDSLDGNMLREMLQTIIDATKGGPSAFARIMGVLRSRTRPDGKTVAYVLDELDGEQLRKDISASTTRAVGETSSAFHQLVALITKGGGATVSAAEVAAELHELLGDAIAGDVADELAERLKS